MCVAAMPAMRSLTAKSKSSCELIVSNIMIKISTFVHCTLHKYLVKRNKNLKTDAGIRSQRSRCFYLHSWSPDAGFRMKETLPTSSFLLQIALSWALYKPWSFVKCTQWRPGCRPMHLAITFCWCAFLIKYVSVSVTGEGPHFQTLFFCDLFAYMHLSRACLSAPWTLMKIKLTLNCRRFFASLLY
jgi:hypothetical protein